MPLEMLMAEAQGLPEEAIMDVLRYTRFIKVEYRRSATPVSEADKPVIRKAGKYKGKIIMDSDFDAPLDEFNGGEYDDSFHG